MSDRLSQDVRDTLEKIELLLNQGKGRQLDANGHEVLDPRPMAPPVGYVRQPSMVEHVRNLVRSEYLRLAAESSDADSFEEADDFDIGDDMDPTTPYEAVFDPPPPPPPADGPKGPGTRPEGGEPAPETLPESGSKAPPAPSGTVHPT